MFTGDVQPGIVYQARPGVAADRYASPEERAWRYMPFERFVDTIATGSLWFTRLSVHATEGDRFEGSSPRYVPDIREEVIRSQGGDVEQFRQQNAAFNLQMLQTVLVNCWHKREHESRPMWERYGKGRPAVAIVSTLERLIDSMPDDVTVGHVDYVDFSMHDEFYSANLFTRAFMKSHDLEDEREVRATLTRGLITENGRWRIEINPGEERGFRVPVNLQHLMAAVVVSDARIHDMARRLLSSAGINVEPLPSISIGDPTY